MRILFPVIQALEQAPSQRFRFEQYLGWLRQRGIECDVSRLLDGRETRLLYSHGNAWEKALLAARAFARRLAEVPSYRRYDVIFVQRQAFLIGGPLFERVAKRLGGKLVYDFDDAIWIDKVSEFNRHFARLKSTRKVSKIIGMADLTLAGNRYLADFASQYTRNVAVVPTTIDTELYQPRPRPERSQQVCIGWSGSFSTIPHFELALPALSRLRRELGDQVRFKVMGDARYRHPGLGISGIAWQMSHEIENLCDIDIGLMPLPDDDWARGKCGLKGLQYMALGIPTLMSPVGVNAEIIEHGRNGFLPRSEDEWVHTLARLVRDPDLRARIGAAGRVTVEERYSVQAWRDTYYQLMRGVAGAALQPRAVV